MSSGTVTTGAVVSCTVTVNETCAGFPAASLAEQVTPVLPNWNRLPLTGEHVTTTTSSRLSVAVGVGKFTAAPSGPVASAAGGSTTGSNTGASTSGGNEK